MSKSPLHWFTDQIILAGMLPPVSVQLLLNRNAIKPVNFSDKWILLTGAP
ncbi:hypothetical protein [Mycobacterium uberis]|nr:hypothetical protein [Mycobacterium uberis]